MPSASTNRPVCSFFGLRFPAGRASAGGGALFVAAVLACACAVPAASAQFNPNVGNWDKDDPAHLRVMTWNVKDGICSSNTKTAARANWAGIVRIIADLRPDVLIIQESGDNGSNGTGSGVDSVSELTTTMRLLIRGGADPFEGGSVGIYVQQFAPTYDLPHIFASTDSDGFNRNLIASRYPFTDLNNDGVITMSDFTILSSVYAPGGDGGVRGFMTAEIDLPDSVYAGDIVVGNSHLKAGGAGGDLAQRLEAAQNIAYFIDYYFNGNGSANPDPLNRVFTPSSPAATLLDANTPVVWGGDWNEDELNNGRKGPAEWMTRAAFTAGTDGTDRDRTDSTFDDARDFFLPTSRATFGTGSSKLDYLAWQDSIATLHRAFVFNTTSIAFFSRPYPTAIAAATSPSAVTGQASDHRPVVIDLVLPLADVTPPCLCDVNNSNLITIDDYFTFLGAFFSELGGPGTIADVDGSGTVEVDDYFAFLGCFFENLNGNC